MTELKEILYEQMLSLLLDEQQDCDIAEIKENIYEVTNTINMFDFSSDEKIKELLYKKLEFIIEKSENKPAEIRENLSLLRRVALCYEDF